MSRARSSAKRTGGRAKAAVFLIISLGAAMGATVVIYNMIQGFQQELARAQEKEATVQVVVARRDIHPGETISEEDLTLFEVAPDFVPESAFFDIAEVRDRVPRERVLKHEFIRGERLAEKNAGAGLNAIIPRGMRAVSIDVTDASSVAGFINPGNFVDVLVTIKTPEGRRKRKTITLLQAVKVLAVNNRLGGDLVVDREGQKVKPSVTLAVTPVEVEKIALSQAEGQMTLTLRSDVDVERDETGGATASTIIGRPGGVHEVRVPEGTTRPRPARGPVRRDRDADSLKIIHGSKVEEQTTTSDGEIVPGGRRRR